MRILIVTQYFWPESFRINDLSLGLLERGHEVTVLTGSPNYPSGHFFEGYGFFNKSEKFNGVKIVRVPLIPRGKGRAVQLALNFFSFACSASILGPFLCKGKYDLIFVYEPSPITVGVPALVMKWIKSAPIVFWVQDLWPESLSATGAVTSNFLLRGVNKLVDIIYKYSDLILVQSKSFIDSVKTHGVASEKILFFPNSADNIFDTCNAATLDVELPKGFKVMFAGNIGASQDFETILTAAELTKHRTDIHWVIIGEGRMLDYVRQEVVKRNLGETFHLIGRHPVETMPYFFSQADVMLVTLKRSYIFSLTIPSKIQAYLASSRPIIAALDGEGAQVVVEAEAGISCPAENPAALADAVMRIYDLPKSRRDELGQNGRRYYENNYDRNLLIDRLVHWMGELVARRAV